MSDQQGFIVIDYNLMSDILTKYGRSAEKYGEQLEERHRIEVVDLEYDDISRILTAHINIKTETEH